MSEKTTPTIDFAGWGKTYLLENLPAAKNTSTENHKTGFLGEWSSTALCGNDITSSCLYVSALSLIYAGILAPLVLALVGLTLYLFRRVYAEVGSALPLNGGTYTLLLNTTSKKIAAAAACLTILSYIATGVISANESIHYLRVVLPAIPVAAGVAALLLVFTALTILGIGESAVIALIIFILHIVTLTVLIGAGLFNLIANPQILIDNLHDGWAHINVGKSLFFGFSIALLGISGFESSANFIEEQKPGVFPKTLKNMWLAIIILNPLIAFISLGIVPVEKTAEFGEGFLSYLGLQSMGYFFSKWIAVDAFLVLSGAVLTSFVGTIGLVRRMALDRCLPQFLLIENKWRKTNHWIVILFLLVCLSIYIFTKGQTTELAGVYTISFLSVMVFFAVGNILLKVKRSKLPRSEYAPWHYVFGGLLLMCIGIAGNLILNPESAIIFFIYYAITLGLVMFLLLRSSLLRFLIVALNESTSSTGAQKSLFPGFRMKLSHIMSRINNVPVIYFSRGDNLASLNEAVLYVLKNEQTHHMTICHVYESMEKVPASLARQIKTIDQLYPRLKVDLLLLKGTFAQPLIAALSEHLAVDKNRMFIGSPTGKFPHRIEHLGGVRMILSNQSTATDGF